jgi:hypothetical protein
MLNRKQTEQDNVDEKRRGKGRFGTRVNGFRDHHIPDESDGIKKGNEKDQITDQAVQEGDDSSHGKTSSVTRKHNLLARRFSLESVSQ